MNNQSKEIFFLICLGKSTSQNDDVKFTDPKDNSPECIATNEANNNTIKIFKFLDKTKNNNKVTFEFSYDKKKYKIVLGNIKEKTFIFDVSITRDDLRYDQSKIEFPEKMEYFIEALDKKNGDNKLISLYNDSINLCIKKPKYLFLINIFVHVFNIELCSKILSIFSKTTENIKQKDAIIKEVNDEKLQKYQKNFDKICENIDAIISKYSFDKINFFGLLLCYLNNSYHEKYKEIVDIIYTNDKKTLFEIMLKYEEYLKKPIEMNKDRLNEMIKFSTTKDFIIFRDKALFYLKDITTFIEIIEKNKNEIIKIKGFEPVGVPKIDTNVNINLEQLKKKTEEIIKFSKEKKLLLIILNIKFWESLKQKYSEVNIDNIIFCSNIRQLLAKYHSLIYGLYKPEENIRKEITEFYKQSFFTKQIHIIIIKYIETQKISNMEIIDLIKDHDKCFTDDRFIKKRSPEILSKIDLKSIDDEFIEKFEKMNFEKIFRNCLDNYFMIFTDKIKKLSDFDIIFKLVKINELSDKKSNYLEHLKNKYNLAIQDIELSEDENIIKNLVNIITFICLNEDKIDFLKEKIGKSKIINEKIKHRIYLELIKFCNQNKNKKIKNFIISHYNEILQKKKLNELNDFLINLTEEDANDFIEKIDDRYIIIENEFYSCEDSFNIKLFNLIKQKIKINEDNKYIKNNIKNLDKIANDIENEEIKYEYLNNFNKAQKEIVIEKLKSLTLVPNSNINNQEDTYENIKKFYADMKGILDELSSHKKTLEYYYQEKKNEEIPKINQNIEAIQNETYSSYYKRKPEIRILLDKSNDITKKVDEVKESTIFKFFYPKSDKNEKEANLFDEAYSEFKEFKKILIEKGPDIIRDSSNQNEIIQKIQKYYQNDKKIQNELSSLISEEQKNEEMLMYFNCKNFEEDLNSIFYFFSYFRENIKIIHELNEWKDKCKNLSNRKDTLELKKILKELKEAGIYDYKENMKRKKPHIELFKMFYGKGDAIDFLYSHRVNDIKHLYDKIEPNRGTLQMNDISNTINCVGFFQGFKYYNGGLKDIIIYFIDNLNENIFDCFKKYSEISQVVSDLYVNFDFSQYIFDEIKEIITNSKFIFNKNSDEFIIYKEKEDENISIDKIRELRNKIQLKLENKKDLCDDENYKNYLDKLEKLKFFKNLSKNIITIYDLMNILRVKGSTLSISISIEISSQNAKYYLGTNEREFKYIYEFLTKAKVNIIEKLDLIYKQMTTIRFIYGKQIDSILNHIQGNIKLDSFLRYLLNLTDCGIKVNEGDKAFDRKTNDYINEYEIYNSDSFDFIQEYIISLFNNNKSSIERHYDNITIKENYKIKGIYTYLSKSESMEEDILQMFLDKIGKIPIAQNILISCKETSIEEMQAFFSRAILCKYNTLFVVEINGSFSNYQQRCMNIFIDKFLTYKNKLFNEKNVGEEVEKSETNSYMDSCLVFIYNKNNESFLNELKHLKRNDFPKINYCQFNKGTKTDDSSSKELYNRTHIIQSEICGLGKSTQIKNRIKKSRKVYIYFPLGGNITKDIIYNKLEHIMKEIDSKTYKNYEDIAIHLDLFDSKENIESILNEFLFSFLITKFYSSNENIIYIPINIEIYIEIPNSFGDFISKYGILKSFIKETDKITLKKLPDLELPKEKIKLLNSMLGVKNNGEIYEWIKDNIGIPRYSYHQIHIFLNLFICQYNIFKGEKIRFYDKDKDVTANCINSFTESTKYFTYGGFSKLLLEKNEKEDSKIDEIDILSKEYDNDVKKENFDKEIKKLIFIVENKNPNRGNNLGVCYKLDISTKALDKGEALGKLTQKKKEERDKKKKKLPLEDFKKLEYLEILKTILDLKNPITRNENNEQKLEPLVEIIERDDYIITMDNFRKMILILYRIIADIPVILMGETGCGKTALIKKLNQLLNNGKENLETINIDPSYNEEKIRKRMDEINEKAKKNIHDKLWVFFDELNTCNSLSLITEIFINRTYDGKKISENIRLIGACNPYRKKKKNKNICGLTYKNENEIQRVYLVNILPQSLMYYVFNFGSLEKENEDQYISSIISDIIENKKLREATKNVISKCHEYLRKTFDPSVVSLREMKRFKKLYHFLINYFEKKKKLEPTRSGTEESRMLKSIIISIYLCYYIRLVDERSRTNFDIELKEPLKKLVNCNLPKKNISEIKEKDIIYDGPLRNDLMNNYKIGDFEQFYFSNILYCEEDFILSNINLEKGIGKNKSLKENIFLLFTALVTNIPLIIIGKPGSSKSLSAKLINKEMTGKNSEKPFFKLYPQIIQSYFQGSDSTTPEEVEGIFKIAEMKLNGLKKNNNNEDIDLPISMILFDELGLAERSKHNPLKALHSRLELDGNKNGISFIGISNWTLDAAKVNRALTLSVPDLDSNLEDLVRTSQSIAESINEDFSKKKIFSKILPNVYLYFKENLKLLKRLTAYKQYVLQNYKNLIVEHREDEKFKNIFADIEDCKTFFQKKAQKIQEVTTNEKEKEKNDNKIFEYDTYKKVKKKLKIFLREKNEENNILSDVSPFKNNNFLKIYDKDKNIKEDFLGNRDFYYLIKGIANEMENSASNKKGIVKTLIERNFGGLEIIIDFEKEDYQELGEFEKYRKEHIYNNFIDEICKRPQWSSVEIFEKIFNIYCRTNEESDLVLDHLNGNEFDYLQNIIDNIKDKNSRYLLLGMKSSLASLIHQKIEKKLGKFVYFYEGSPFLNDNNHEYQFKIINQIQEHAEKGDIIILHNLKQIYAFLYDLFNKNFIIKDGKQYARICLGNISEQLTPISERFRVIIIVNKLYLEKVEPPFLNRFEKMLLSFSKLITKNQENLAKIIFDSLNIDNNINKFNFEINYKLNDLLIGCQREDILGMIYYEYDNDETKKNDKIIDIIYEKVYKLLPQDIILNLDNENKLKKLYKNKKYYRLKNYLESNPKQKISIIYTFNNINSNVETIEESASINLISEMKTESQLFDSINSIISENNNKNQENKNLIFIHVDNYNSNKIGFLVSFVKNHYEKIRELKFIFIIYVKRNFFVDQQNEKIFAIPDIYPDIYQIFIDNLEGPDVKLDDIISDPIKKLIEEEIIIIEDEFNNALKQFTDENLKSLYGDNDIINYENYLTKLKDYFEDDENKILRKSITQKVEAYIKDSNVKSNKIIENAFKLINKDTIDIISVIIDFIKKEIFSKYIKIILCKLEDNNIITSLLVIYNNKNLSNYDLNETLYEMIKQYINDMNLEENNSKPKFILSFIIPCFYKFYVKISDFIQQNIQNDFFRNEKTLRNQAKSKRSKDDTLENYYKKEEYLLYLTYEESKNYKFFFDYNNRISPELILNDYITYFIIKYNSIDEDSKNALNYQNVSYNDCKHELINLIIKIRFDGMKRIVSKNKNNALKLLILKFNWIESNKDFLIKILKIYDILKDIFEENEFIKIISKVLNSEKLRYITHEKKNHPISIEVNECFYKILASLCYSIIPPYINFKNKINSNTYIDSLKNSMKILKTLNNELNLFSIEIDLIDELIQIYEILSINEKLDNNELSEICNILKKINLILIINKEINSDDLIDEFKGLISKLNKILKYNDKEYFQLLKFIYYKEIKKVPNISYRTAIFQEVIKDAEVLINSNDILQIILFGLVRPKKDTFPKSIIEILNSTDYDIAVIIENILSNENETDKIYNALNETLLYYFEKNSLMYFHDIFHGKPKILFENDDGESKKKSEDKKQSEDIKKINIVGPLKLFNRCVIFLNDYNSNNDKLNGMNKNICKLFCLGYIRAYCYTFVDLYISESSNLENTSKIINEINNSKTLTKIISFYVWKIIYNKNRKNISIFIDSNYIKYYNLEKYNCFQKVEIDENPFTYNFMKPEGKESCEQFNQFLEKYKEKKFEEVDLEEFKNNKIDIDVFYFSTSISILSRLRQKLFVESPIYKNFFKNVCIPLFKNNKIFSAIKLLYEPQSYRRIVKDLGITTDNINIILHSYRYFINELYSNSQNNIFSAFYSRHIELKKINNYFYPGNIIRNIPIYSLYSEVNDHFNNFKNNHDIGCFVCLCENGGYYHRINGKGGIPNNKNYLKLVCSNCHKNIGSIYESGRIIPVKRDNYYRIFTTEEEVSCDSNSNGKDYYNRMSLEAFKQNYIINEYKKEKGIQKIDKSFFTKDTNIVRSLSQISFRILNFILYSHLLFSKIYNDTNSLDKCLPDDMKWGEVINECWIMIKNELNKMKIDQIDTFMNYIFADLFSALNEHKSIDNYNDLDEFEKNLEELIMKKVLSFKENYKSLNLKRNNKLYFQNLIEERQKEVDKEEFPFYQYFYFSDYIDEAYLLNKLNYTDKEKKYPVLLKVLENSFNKKENPYSLDNLPNFNNVLNLFNEKYSCSIKRDRAKNLELKDIKDEELYINNRDEIKEFINFFNNLSDKDVKSENLKLSEQSKLEDFFIVDDNEFGKSYKKIYANFIKEQNKQISDILDIKIKKGIFEKNCKNKINIQSSISDEIFITNLPENFSLIEVIFNNSYRNSSLEKDYNMYNQIHVNLDLIEDELTELLLRNKKLFNDIIINFIYSNEKLEFENTNIITEFNGLYEIKDINIKDKIILYQFYNDNEEKNDDFFKNIFNDFIQLILYLNDYKKLLNENNKDTLFLKNDTRISEVLEKFNKVTTNFKDLFKEKESLTISKTTYLFEYYRDLIFKRVKNGLKNFQYDLNDEQKELIKKCFREQALITEKVFKSTIRSFIVLFLNLEKDKENNIKENKNNFVNYLDIPDIWDSTISRLNNFHKELNKLKECNVCINQIIGLYEFLGEDIDDNYFEEVKKAKLEEEKEKKIDDKQKELLEEEENLQNNNYNNDDSFDYGKKSDDDYEDDGDSKYI